MKKTLLFLSVAFFLATASTAAVHTVLVSDFTFTPANVTAHVGDTVRWVWSNGSHTTTSGTIPSGAAAWDAPITSGSTTFQYKLTQAGTYNYVCTPHAPGMAGVINVQSATSVPQQPVALFHITSNPTSGTLRIDLAAGQDPTGISVVDATGRLISSGNYSGEKVVEIPTTGLANGIYIIRANSAGKSYAERFEIVR